MFYKFIITGLMAIVFMPGYAQQNTLTKQEKKDGWKLLFNGKNTKDWRGYLKEDFPSSGWEIEKEALVCLASNPGQPSGGDIITVKQFDNFELRLEWKISRKGNSGIMYFVKEIDGRDISNQAPEMQIMDSYELILSNQSAGALNELIIPVKKTEKEHGEWNEARIVAKDGIVEHWQNGTLVLTYSVNSDEWADRVMDSKFAQYPEFVRMVPAGHIGLQDAHSEVAFRNIKIRKL